MSYELDPAQPAGDHYATAVQLFAMKGVNNVGILSNTENETTAADDDRIEAALAYADRYIDDFLAGVGITTPVASPPASLSDIAVQLAYVYLMDARVFTVTESDGSGLGRELFFAMREAKRRLSRLAAFGMGGAARLSIASTRPTWDGQS